ncbi:acyltransferase family protein [Serratia sp. (in: enterobacteria)]|uniref:acyltransferase family protein n=1 Tax=Serratia sp. (in: enterobacteria) TaxID=616 RepID=UPI0039890663
MQRKEMKALTGLRGIAAILVMFYHFNLSAALSSPLHTIIGQCYLMVDLFFILSGFIILMTYGHWFSYNFDRRDFGRYVLRRFARIFPLYACMTLTAGALVASSWMDRWPGPPVPVSILVNLTMLQTLFKVPSLDTPAWSVSAEWIASLLFPFLAYLFYRYNWRAVLSLFFVAILALPLITIAPELIQQPKRAGIMDIWHYGTYFPVLRAVAGFIIGMAIFRFSQIRWVMELTFKSWFNLSILSLILFSLMFKNADLITVSLFPLLVLGLTNNDSKVTKTIGSPIIYRLGVLSYSIYLIHNQLNYFMLILKGYLLGIGVGTTSATIICCILFSIITILISELTYRLIENPARNYLRKVGWLDPQGKITNVL